MTLNQKYNKRIVYVVIVSLLAIFIVGNVSNFETKFPSSKDINQNANNQKLGLSSDHKFKKENHSNFFEAILPKQKNNLLCIVLTSNQTIFKRGHAVYDTWASNCTKTVLACNSKDIKNEKNLIDKNIELLEKINIIHLPINESYQRMGEKVLITLETVFKLFGEKFNWFLLVDDDTYIYTRNLFKFIDNHDSNMPFTYGYIYKVIVPTGYHAGGGGTLITHESLKRLVHKINSNECLFKDGPGDVALGRCSAIANVTLESSVDSNGRERFHPMDVDYHFSGYFPDWIFEYSANKVKSGVDCCSLESISFHYVSSENMYQMSLYENYLDFLINVKSLSNQTLKFVR